MMIFLRDFWLFCKQGSRQGSVVVSGVKILVLEIFKFLKVQQKAQVEDEIAGFGTFRVTLEKNRMESGEGTARGRTLL